MLGCDLMIIKVILLVLGFVILIKGADIFVDGASSVAGNFKVSKMLIGLTIVAFGTSAPEFAVSVKSIISGNYDIVLGNVIGSNILNILLILGVSALVHSLNVKNNTVKKELPITLLMSTLFGVSLLDSFFDDGFSNAFTRSDGVIILLFFFEVSSFTYFLLITLLVIEMLINSVTMLNNMTAINADIFDFIITTGITVAINNILTISSIIFDTELGIISSFPCKNPL